MVAPAAVMAALPQITEAVGSQNKMMSEAFQTGLKAATEISTSYMDYAGKPIYHVQWDDGSYLDITPGAVSMVGGGLALAAVAYVLWEIGQPAYRIETKTLPGFKPGEGFDYEVKVPNPPSQLLIFLENVITAWAPGSIAQSIWDKLAGLV